MRIIIRVDAAGGKVGDVDAFKVTHIDKVQGTNHIGSDGGLFVILAPVDVRPAGDACTIQDMGWFKRFQITKTHELNGKELLAACMKPT